MNESGNNIFSSDFIRYYQFNGWFSEPKSKDLNAYDYNKHYTTCLMGEGLSFGWPVYSVFDEVNPFDGEIKAGYLLGGLYILYFMKLNLLMVILKLVLFILILIISFHLWGQDGMMRIYLLCI